MTKKILAMMIIPFIITSNAAAMLVKVSKFSKLKTSQLVKRNLLIDFPKGRDINDKNIVSYRQRHLVQAVFEDDVEIANFLLERGERIPDGYIMRSGSIKMTDLFEKYGTNIQELYTRRGNFLHYAINNHQANNNLIQYLIDKGVDPRALTSDGNNLWYGLINMHIDKEDTLLYRGRLLHKLGISPCHINNDKKSAIDVLEQKISYDDDLWPFANGMYSKQGAKRYVEQCQKRYKLLLKIMKDKSFVQEKINKE